MTRALKTCLSILLAACLLLTLLPAAFAEEPLPLEAPLDELEAAVEEVPVTLGDDEPEETEIPYEIQYEETPEEYIEAEQSEETQSEPIGANLDGMGTVGETNLVRINYIGTAYKTDADGKILIDKIYDGNTVAYGLEKEDFEVAEAYRGKATIRGITAVYDGDTPGEHTGTVTFDLLPSLEDDEATYTAYPMALSGKIQVDISGFGANMTLGDQEYKGAEYTVADFTDFSLYSDFDNPMTLGTDYTATYENNIKAGTATVTFTGIGKYTGSFTKSFKINPVDISNVDVAPSPIPPQTPGATPELTLTDSLINHTLVVGEDEDYKVEYLNNTTVGENTAIARITGTRNYTGTRDINFSIDTATTTTRTLKITLISGNEPSRVYDGTANCGYWATESGKSVYHPLLTQSSFAIEGIADDDTLTLTQSYLNGLKFDAKDAGSRTVSIDFTGHFTNSNNKYTYVLSEDSVKSITGTITPKTVTVTPAAGQSKVEGESDPFFKGSVKGVLSGDTVTGKLSRESGECPGTYAITKGTLSGGNNYDIIVANEVFTIYARTTHELTITYKGATPSKLYDGTDDCNLRQTDFEITNGVVSGDTVRIDSVTATYDSAEVGTGKTVTVSFVLDDSRASNTYQANPITITGEITEPVKTNRTVKITLKSGREPKKTYDGTANCGSYDSNKVYHPLLSSADFDFNGVAAGDTVTIDDSYLLTLKFDSKAAGYRTVSLNFASHISFTSSRYNYVVSTDSVTTIRGTIFKKALTVRPSPAEQSVDENNVNNYTIKASVSGFLAGDTVTGKLGHEGDNSVGKHRISLGTLSFGNNYEIILEYGVLNITRSDPIWIEPERRGSIGLKETIVLRGVISNAYPNISRSNWKWESSNKSVATVKAENMSALVTGKKVGATTITAMTPDKSYIASYVIQVVDNQTPTDIWIDSDDEVQTIGVKEKLQLSATMTAIGTPKSKLTWKSSDKKVATVSNKGLVTGKKAGTATITVTTANKLSDSIVIEVKDATAPTGVTLSPSGSRTIGLKDKLQLTATLKPAGTAKSKLKWATSDKKVATVSTKGLVTGKKAGRAIITVTTDNKLTASVEIVVEDIHAPTSVAIQPASPAPISVKGKLQLTARLTAIDTPKSKLKWTSSDKKVAIVNAKGLVTGKKPGKAIITVTTDNKLTASVEITVK